MINSHDWRYVGITLGDCVKHVVETTKPHMCINYIKDDLVFDIPKSQFVFFEAATAKITFEGMDVLEKWWGLI